MEKPDFTKPGRTGGRNPNGLGDDLDQKIRSLVPVGFREIGLGTAPTVQGGPGEPPEDFVGGTTSKTEWYVYWALEKLLGPQGIYWTYQESFAGGRHIPGGAVVDYVIYMPRRTILLRVVTWRFHFSFGAEKIQLDYEQKIQLFGLFGEEVVVDIYEQHFINDPTGKKVLDVTQDAINGLEWPSPISTGLAGDW